MTVGPAASNRNMSPGLGMSQDQPASKGSLRKSSPRSAWARTGTV
jgi:hypothetical protein